MFDASAAWFSLKPTGQPFARGSPRPQSVSNAPPARAAENNSFGIGVWRLPTATRSFLHTPLVANRSALSRFVPANHADPANGHEKPTWLSVWQEHRAHEAPLCHVNPDQPDRLNQ